MVIKLVVGEYTLNVISAYAPHAGLSEEVKQRFWEGIYEIVCHVPPAEKLFIGGDFNGHIGANAGGYGEVHGGFGFGERNGGGTTLLDFAKAFGRCDNGLCKDCKVIPSEALATQHRLLVIDVGIRLSRRKRSARGSPRIR
uniref:Craniofacial development protein 2-like n=1 Tax=Nicotiana sylvestris TaxID=4096 RepID=A0A1U7YRB7_NICSY|nr:PREDICTED: craniofacial development protein 2-like [Nicotiana sylvestris]